MKKVLLIILAIIILIVGYFIYAKSVCKTPYLKIFVMSRNKEGVISDAMKCEYYGWKSRYSTPVNTNKITETQNQELKTYTNKTYGFTVQYPADGFITHDGQDQQPGYYGVEIRTKTPQAFFISISPNAKNLAEFSKATVDLARQQGGEVKDTTVSGLPALRVIRKTMEGNEIRSVLFVKDGNGYFVNLVNLQGSEFEIPEKVLTTFKFVN